ncbi:MAG: cache domain-containing protein [Magnetospiraceae bacterium]
MTGAEDIGAEKGNRRGSRLKWKLLALIVPFVMVLSVAFYGFSVPLIETRVYNLERLAARNILDTVFEIASRIQVSLSTHRQETLNAYKQELRTVVSLASAYIDTLQEDVATGRLTREQARQKAFERLRTFKYGRNDYIWICDYNYTMVSHPDPEFHQQDASDWRDTGGNLIVPPMVELARQNGEGFHTYSWRRLGKTVDSEKVSYFKDLPSWGVVLGTGVYLDDVEEKVQARKALAIGDMRRALRDVRLSDTGYVYVFDANLNMIIHPNPNIEQTYFGTLKNPVTGNLIGKELIGAADSPDGFYYKWDHPDDPGNYVYEKIAWIRHLEELDWYIASSVYVDELRTSSHLLRDRILLISLTTLVASSLLGWLLIGRLVNPIRRLADTASEVRAGNLTARSGIQRDDEIGLLSRTFDEMIEKMGSNIDTLDNQVQERTAALEASNARLQEALSDQQTAREALSESEWRQRLILDAQPAQIAYLDRADRRLLFANRAFAEFHGVAKTKLVGGALETVLGAGVMADLTPFIDRAFEGDQQVFEYALNDAAHHRRVTKNTYIPDQRSDGAPAGVFLVMLDVTEEKRAAEHLLEAQRMHAVGQLSGGLAHDFNNLLSVILGNLAAAEEKCADRQELGRYLEPAMRAARRGADITSRLLAFARRQSLKPTSVDVAAVADDVAMLLRGTFPRNVEILVERPDSPCWAFVDAAQLENALINLCLNARDAMPRGGGLTLRVSVDAEEGGTNFDETVPPGTYICVEVEDGGEGFNPEALERGFEPFFTTKKGGAGSGLGLSMVYGFVKQSSGFIHLGNTKVGGARVMILLPLGRDLSGMIAGSTDIKRRKLVAAGGQLVLLVEDDPDVRKVIQRQLRELGYAVLEAENGDEAIGLLNSVADIQVMVSDVVMPGEWSGHDLAVAVRDIRPDIRVVLISGFAFEETLQPDSDTPFVTLRKPFDKFDLNAAILNANSNKTDEEETSA